MEDIDIKMEVDDDITVVKERADDLTEVAKGEGGLYDLSVTGRVRLDQVCDALDKLKDLVLELLHHFPVYMPRSEEKKLLGLPFQDKNVLDESDFIKLKSELENKMYGSECENFGLSNLEFSLEKMENCEKGLEKYLTKISTLNDKLVPYVDHVKKKAERKKAEDRKEKVKTEGRSGKKRDPQTRDTTKYPIKGLTDKDVSPIRGEFDMMKTLQSVEKSQDVKKRLDDKDKSPIREGFNMRNLIRREEFDRAQSEGSNGKLDLLESAIERLKSNIQAGIKKNKRFELTKDYEFFMGMFNAEAKKWSMDEKLEHIKNFNVAEFVATKFSSDGMAKIQERVQRVNKYNSTIENEYNIKHSRDASKGDVTKDVVKGKSGRRNRADEGDLLDEVLKLRGKSTSRSRRAASRGTSSRRSRRRSWSRGRSRSRGGRSRSGCRRSRSRGRRSRSRGNVRPFADVQPGAVMGSVGGFNMGVLNTMTGTGGIPNIAGNLGSILLMQEIQKLGINLGANMSGQQLEQLGVNMGIDQNTLGGSIQNYVAGLQNLIAKQQTNMSGHQQPTVGGYQNYINQQQNSINLMGGFQKNMGGPGNNIDRLRNISGMEKNMGGTSRGDLQRNMSNSISINTGGGLKNDIEGTSYEDHWHNMPLLGQHDNLDRPRGMDERQKVLGRQNPTPHPNSLDRIGTRSYSDDPIFGEKLPTDRIRSETRFGSGFTASSSASDHDRRGEMRGETGRGSGFPARNSPPRHDLRGEARFGSGFPGNNSPSARDLRAEADYGTSQSSSWATRNSAQGSTRISAASNFYNPERSTQTNAGGEQKGRNWKEFTSQASSRQNSSGYKNNT